MPAEGSLAGAVGSVKVERFELDLGSMAAAGVVVIVAEVDLVFFCEDDVDLPSVVVEPLVRDLVSDRLGAFFSRNPSMNSIPIHRKM